MTDLIYAVTCHFYCHDREEQASSLSLYVEQKEVEQGLLVVDHIHNVDFIGHRHGQVVARKKSYRNVFICCTSL